MNLNFFLNSYRWLEAGILSFLTKGRLSEKQVDALAVKLDLFGVFCVTQVWFALTKYGWHFWPTLVLFVFSLFFCAILWIVAFIMKGYKNAV